MSDKSETPHKAGLFDIRIFIGALLGIYGVILVITGLVATSDTDLTRADNINVNLWTGIALVIASIVFITWARLRPVVVPPHAGDDGTEGETPAAHHGH